MAAVTHRVSTPSSVDGTSYASGSFTPALGDLIVVLVAASDTGVAVPTLTGSVAMTYKSIRTQIWRTSLDKMWLWVASNLAQAVSQTVTFDCTGDAATGCIIEVFSISGMSTGGIFAIRQGAGQDNQAAAGTPVSTLPVACLTGNPVLAFLGNNTNPATVTPPSTFTERDDTGYATPTTGAEYATVNSGFTGTAVTWGSTSGSTFASMAVEFDATARVAIPEIVRFQPAVAKAGL